MLKQNETTIKINFYTLMKQKQNKQNIYQISNFLKSIND